MNKIKDFTHYNMEPATPGVERHPLAPFLPHGARVLLLGSFPPPRRRWSMEFFYPNLQNDMWRIFGLLLFGDRNRLLRPGGKAFDREAIEAICREKGVALYDTSAEVIRLKNNASDEFLQVVREVDLEALLRRIPDCRDIALTGQKAALTLQRIVGCELPPLGGYVAAAYAGRELRIWRMPSSSRAYPLALDRKAEAYRRLFEAVGILPEPPYPSLSPSPTSSPTTPTPSSSSSLPSSSLSPSSRSAAAASSPAAEDEAEAESPSESV